MINPLIIGGIAGFIAAILVDTVGPTVFWTFITGCIVLIFSAIGNGGLFSGVAIIGLILVLLVFFLGWVAGFLALMVFERIWK